MVVAEPKPIRNNIVHPEEKSTIQLNIDIDTYALYNSILVARQGMERLSGEISAQKKEVNQDTAKRDVIGLYAISQMVNKALTFAKSGEQVANGGLATKADISVVMHLFDAAQFVIYTAEDRADAMSKHTREPLQQDLRNAYNNIHDINHLIVTALTS